MDALAFERQVYLADLVDVALFVAAAAFGILTAVEAYFGLLAWVQALMFAAACRSQMGFRPELAVMKQMD